jgi:TonB family protein
VQRFNERQGFLISAMVHLVVLMSLVSHPLRPVGKEETPPPPPPSRAQTVFMPPQAVLRQLLPPSSRPPMRPRPTPPPPEAAPERKKDRISIGPPSEERSRKPLILRKEDDLTAAPKGIPNATPSAPPSAPPQTASERAGGARETPGSPGLKLAPGTGTEARGTDGTRERPGPPGPSIASSLASLESKLKFSGTRGITTGTGRQMGPLFFDPEGADFTVWINQFKDEVYRNWIVPEPALLGFRGHVDLEFTVERDGTLTNLKMLKSSGTPALDRAAQNALTASRLFPLPRDFGPPRVTMQVGFFYNEGPQGS